MPENIDTSQNDSDKNTENTENNEETDELPEIIEYNISSITENSSIEENRIYNIIKKIAIQIIDYPFKMLASFIFAPFLLFSLLLRAKDKIRKLISISGLSLAVMSLYFCKKYPLVHKAISSFLKDKITPYISSDTEDQSDVQDQHENVYGISQIINTFNKIFEEWKMKQNIEQFFDITSLIFIFWIICFLFLKFSSERMANYLRRISS